MSISCQQLKILRKAGRWWLFQNLAPSAIMCCQCDIWMSWFWCTFSYQIKRMMKLLYQTNQTLGWIISRESCSPDVITFFFSFLNNMEVFANLCLLLLEKNESWNWLEAKIFSCAWIHFLGLERLMSFGEPSSPWPTAIFSITCDHKIICQF